MFIVPDPPRETNGLDSHLMYLSSPLSTYKTPRYARMLAYCRAALPDAEILEPKHLFHSSTDWRAKWPDVLGRIDQLVFFHDADPDWVGAGVIREIHDTFELGKSICYLDDGGQLHPFEAVRFEFPEDATIAKLARVRMRK